MQCSELVGSQFWKGVLKIREKLKWGLRVKIGNGQGTRFWEDVWVGEITLKLEFPRLYALSKDSDCLVADCWVGDGWKLEFNRPLGEDAMTDWERLIDILDDFCPNEEEDTFIWVLEKSGVYSTSTDAYSSEGLIIEG